MDIKITNTQIETDSNVIKVIKFVDVSIEKDQIVVVVNNMRKVFIGKEDNLYINGALITGTLADKVKSFPDDFFVEAPGEGGEILDAAKAYTDESVEVVANGQKPAVLADSPTDGIFVYPVSTAGTYTNFGGVVVSSGDLASNLVQLRYQGGSWVKVLTALPVAIYPFQNGATFSSVTTNIKNAIIDAEVIGGDRRWRPVIYTLQRNVSNVWYIRIGIYKSDDTLDSTIGNNGIICSWQVTGYTEPSLVNGKRVDTILFTALYGGVISASITIDWEALTENVNSQIQSYTRAGLSSLIINSAKATPALSVKKTTDLPASQEQVFTRASTLTIGNLKEAIISATLRGVTDNSKLYGIENLRYGPDSSRSFITVCEYASNGTKGSRVAIWDVTGYVPPTLSNGKRLATLTLSQANSSGITGSITIDWEKIPLSGTGWVDPYWNYSGFAFNDAIFSIKTYQGTGGKIKQVGAADTTFQIGGINARVVTSTGYDSEGTPDTLMIVCHGNGQMYSNADPSSTAKSFFAANKISWAVIQIQDQSSAPYNTNAVGWGNEITIQRVIALYHYLQEKYNFYKDVILSGQSMGGLTVGHLAHTMPFPIRFCLGIGPVPGLKYIFDNGGSTRKQAIRAAYGMAADGSDDANLQQFIQGYDWYSKGAFEISGTRYKLFPPHLYAAWGNGDSTFTTDFGGTAFCSGLINSINAAGGKATYGEVSSVTHADPSVYDKHISDGVFLKEMGIS